MLPRGIRNNNPLNIRRTAKDQWKGLRAQQTDASFCQFESMEDVEMTKEKGMPSVTRALKKSSI